MGTVATYRILGQLPPAPVGGALARGQTLDIGDVRNDAHRRAQIDQRASELARMESIEPNPDADQIAPRRRVENGAGGIGQMGQRGRE